MRDRCALLVALHDASNSLGIFRACFQLQSVDMIAACGSAVVKGDPQHGRASQSKGKRKPFC
jgi:hypothetical protein